MLELEPCRAAGKAAGIGHLIAMPWWSCAPASFPWVWLQVPQVYTSPKVECEGLTALPEELLVPGVALLLVLQVLAIVVPLSPLIV